MLTTAGFALAEDRHVNLRRQHQPLSQSSPTGQSARWMSLLNGYGADEFQPIRVGLGAEGRISIFDGSTGRFEVIEDEGLVALQPGRTYRLRLSEMTDFPGVELFPSIEVLDRIHPPPGRQWEFPVPLWLTLDEIEYALQGRLVTKVIYLEQPQTASPHDIEDPEVVTTIPYRQNLLAQADERGRPMLFVRLGGRLPSITGDNRHFHGDGAPWRRRPDQHPSGEAQPNQL